MEIEVDSTKLIYRPERVSEWKTKGDCFPIYVEIGPTNRCNHKCLFCALDWIEHGGADINTEILCRNLEDMASRGVKSVMFAGEGEPLLHKDIPLFVRTAKKADLDVSITSNGIPFTEEKIDEILGYLSWVRFSIDSGTAETYAEVHGTVKKDFNKAMKHIAYAAETKRRNSYEVVIGVQALLTNKSLNELEILARKLKEIGADNLQIKPYSHHPSSKNDLRFDFEEAEKIRPALEALSDKRFQIIYRTQTIKRLCQERTYDVCRGLPFFALIDAKGNVIPCNLFYNNPEFIYGNINQQLFSEIWLGEKRREVLNRIKKRGLEGCRKGCRLDADNRYLHRLKNPHPHDNFM